MYHFIVNKTSRTGGSGRTWNRIKEELNRRKVKYTVHYTEYAGHATKIAESLCADYDGIKSIVVVGGDGTANETINGFHGYQDILFGYIPVGSGNDLARGLGIPKDPMAALDHILSPKRYQYVDHGILSYYDGSAPKRFAISSGIGYDADICLEVQGSKLKKVLNFLHMGKLVYILIAVKQIITNRPVDVEVLMNGQQKRFLQDTVFIASMIQKYEGGGLKMAPDADNADGKLSVCFVSKLPKLKLFLVMPSIFFAKHTSIKGVEIINCSSLELKAAEPMVLHVDGEYAGKKEHVRLSCLPDQIRMYV